MTTFDDLLEKFGGVMRGAGIIGKVSVNSILNSLIWIIGLFCIVLIFSFFTGVNDWRVLCLIVFLGLVLIVFLFSFGYFAKNNPDALRSETFNLETRKYQLEMMGQKNKEIPIEAIVIENSEKIKQEAISKKGEKNGK